MVTTALNDDKTVNYERTRFMCNFTLYAREDIAAGRCWHAVHPSRIQCASKPRIPQQDLHGIRKYFKPSGEAVLSVTYLGETIAPPPGSQWRIGIFFLPGRSLKDPLTEGP